MHSSPTDHSYLHQACITPVCKTRDDFDPTANRKELGRRNFARVLSWGRVVECSTTRRRPDVFVAGVYLGCRVILLNAISAPFLTASCMHATAEGENTRLLAAVVRWPRVIISAIPAHFHFISISFPLPFHLISTSVPFRSHFHSQASNTISFFVITCWLLINHLLVITNTDTDWFTQITLYSRW